MAKLTSFAVSLPLTAILIVLLASCLQVQAQTCYYPNGDLSPNDSPCHTEGGACCPLNWECFSNGLCFLPAEHYYERHSCTDQSWNDPNCPNVCTYDGSAAGNEAILFCDPSDLTSWCCDGNRSFDCCNNADATSFSLWFGTEVGVIKVEPSTMTSRATSTTAESNPLVISDDSTSPSLDAELTSFFSIEPETSSATTSSTASSTSFLASTSTITLTATTSDSDGQVITMTSVSVVTTAPPSPTKSTSASRAEEAQAQHDHKLMVLAVSIAVPLGLIALGLLFWILRRHQKHKAHSTFSANQDVFCPPDPPQTQPKAELDTQQPVHSEKYQQDVPSELEGSPILVHPPTSPGPVTQTASYNPRTYRVSSLSPSETATDLSRWSEVSSMGPPSNRQSAGAAGLLAVSQQHYGAGGQQQQQYQPYGPPSGLPPPAELE